LIGDREIKIKVIGIRPGEKIHEILVSEEEANRCIERGEYLVIKPMLPELRDGDEGAASGLTQEFSSADNVLDLAGTLALLRNHNLMVEDIGLSPGTDLLR
jgi:UDP-glucose 4-epimerase